jgi:hypothetical protein
MDPSSNFLLGAVNRDGMFGAIKSIQTLKYLDTQ